jgi:hypothetical protein
MGIVSRGPRDDNFPTAARDDRRSREALDIASRMRIEF